jgi:NDP-sugar pyrophosphorylase family protein
MLPIAILAGGLGTRLGIATQRLPKALVPVHGRPFVDYQLELLRQNGYERIVFCVSHFGDMIEQHVAQSAGDALDITYAYDGPQRMGTAGALKAALPYLGDVFSVIYGDSYLLCDYAAVERAFISSRKSGLMTVYRNDGDLAPSNVLYVDGKILGYNKAQPTPDMKHIDFGLSVFNRGALDEVHTDRPTDLADVFQSLLFHDQLAGFETATRFYEVGTPEGIAKL